MAKTRIGVLTSGGDCPGLNAVIHGICKAAGKLDWEVVGIRDGYEGLLPPGDHVVLDRKSSSGIMHLGGTILGTTNRGHFMARSGSEGKGTISRSVLEKARATVQGLGLSALITIGGDGSLATALQLFEHGIPVVGVPKTIDNDLGATDMSFGFASAVVCVSDALDRLHTTATSHKRVMLLEVMGRHAGWIALYGGLSGGADIILIPEIPFEYDAIAREVMRREARGAASTLIVVAEGASPKNGRQTRHSTASGENRLGGIGERIGKEIATRTKKDVRTCVLGHLQRGGTPTPLDRILGIRFGVKAVQLIAESKFGSMVSCENNLILDVPISHAVHRSRRVDPQSQMVATARAVEISFGDEPRKPKTQNPR